MRDCLSNFSRVDDILAATQSFYALAADVCDANVHRARSARDAYFLQYAARAARQFSASVARHRAESNSPALKAWLQYTPDDPLPGRPELWALMSHGHDAARTLDGLVSASARWADVHARLEAGATSPATRELQASVRAQLDGWSRGLNTAYSQRLDM